jgi:cell division protein FtsL
MEQKTTMDGLIQRFFEMAYTHIRFLFFLFILCMIYIWNNHMAQKLVTDINKKAKELKELRWDYLTIKADLMYRSKLTEVLPRAQKMNLEEMSKPPYKLTIKKKDYQRQD